MLGAEGIAMIPGVRAKRRPGPRWRSNCCEKGKRRLARAARSPQDNEGSRAPRARRPRDPRRLLERHRRARARVTILPAEQPGYDRRRKSQLQAGGRGDLPRAEFDKLWSREYLERLARTYWHFSHASRWGSCVCSTRRPHGRGLL